MKKLRICYAFWGFLADEKLDGDGEVVSSPDGNATYSGALVSELIARGHRVYPGFPLRDGGGRCGVIFEECGFSAFSTARRKAAIEHLWQNGACNPLADSGSRFDLLLLEWRWPITGRNSPTDQGKSGYQPDLRVQQDLLWEAKKLGVPVAVWDLDHKLMYEDIDFWGIDFVLETALESRWDMRASLGEATRVIRVKPPIDHGALLDLPSVNAAGGLTYVGSRYERDEQIDQWLPASVAAVVPVNFYGKWDGDARHRWPHVSFHDRVGVWGMRAAYGQAAGVPLLAKSSYRTYGFMTPRPAEAVMFGSIPIGLDGHRGAEQYCPVVAHGPADLAEIGSWLVKMTNRDRNQLRVKAAEMLRDWDASCFVDAIEGIVG